MSDSSKSLRSHVESVSNPRQLRVESASNPRRAQEKTPTLGTDEVPRRCYITKRGPPEPIPP
eukprot:532428-Pyramimonas_sp.AAC.1